MPEPTSIRQPHGPRPVPLAERFERQIERDPATGCWHWRGGSAAGKPAIRVKRGDAWVTEYAYRVAWELAHGTPPSGDLRRTCSSADCVAPAHYTETSRSESRRLNILRFWREETQ